MSLTAPAFLTLEATLEDLGQAWVVVGNPHSASGMAVLGLTPGDITPNITGVYQDRIYEEYSSQPVQSKLKGWTVDLTIPLIWGDPTIYAKVSPTASAKGGHTTPQNLTYTTMILIPDKEFQSNWAVAAGTWTYPVGGPKHAVWIPKGFFRGAMPTFGSLNTENKNRTGSVGFTGVLQDSANWPEGTKSYVIGDPLDFSVLNLAI